MTHPPASVSWVFHKPRGVCQTRSLPLKPKFLGMQIGFFTRKMGVVFQSAIYAVPLGWQTTKNCLSKCYSPRMDPHYPSEPGTQGVSLSYGCKNWGTRYIKTWARDMCKSSPPGDTGTVEHGRGRAQKTACTEEKRKKEKTKQNWKTTVY